MIATTLERDEIARWVASAAVVLAVHAAAAAMVTRWHEPISGDEGSAVVVDLEPYASPATQSTSDIAPGPLQQQAEPVPPLPPEKREEKAEKIEPPPPALNPEVVVPPETLKPPDIPREEPRPPTPETTAPPRPRPSAAEVTSWYRRIGAQIERHKGFPTAAAARNQKGIVQLAFTIDRQGRLVASRIVQSSGFAALDQETIATVRRAEPFPLPPPNMAGETFDFTVPIQFNIR
jgi:protein TonB